MRGRRRKSVPGRASAEIVWRSRLASGCPRPGRSAPPARRAERRDSADTPRGGLDGSGDSGVVRNNRHRAWSGRPGGEAAAQRLKAGAARNASGGWACGRSGSHRIAKCNAKGYGRVAARNIISRQNTIIQESVVVWDHYYGFLGPGRLGGAAAERATAACSVNRTKHSSSGSLRPSASVH